MPTIAALLDSSFRSAIQAAFGVEADPLIGVSQNEKFGDYQSNAAMGLAKKLAETTGQKSNPRGVAEEIKSRLSLGDMASDVKIAGPGFINVTLAPAWLASKLAETRHDPRLGIESAAEAPSPSSRTPGEGRGGDSHSADSLPRSTGGGEKTAQTVVVDYSGPNVAKQMHVGHLRSTIIGDAIARLLEFQGHKVIRQNHIGDWGTQFGMLIAYTLSPAGKTDAAATLAKLEHGPNGDAKSASERSLIEDLERFYRAAKARFDTDEGFRILSRLLVVRLQRGEGVIVDLWQDIVNETRLHYLPLYQKLNVKLSVADERGESFYNSMLPTVVHDLLRTGLAVESSAPVEEPEEDGVVTAATEPGRADRRIVVFIDGFKNPLIIQKTDGGYLYGTTDLAAIRYRINELHATRIIYTHDSRQAQHFALVFATAKKAGWADGVSLEYAPFGTMLGEDGKPFKTRSGDTVKLKDLLDEAEERARAIIAEKNPELPIDQQKQIAHAVGIGAVKYSDLSKDRVSDYVFSWDKMLSFDGNTAPYLQNAYVRIQSIFRKAGARPAPDTKIELASPHELAVAKHVLRLGETLDLVSRELKPHYLCTYLFELATKFHAFYENCPVIQSDEPTRSSRLVLCELTARTLATGLDLLGIEHPDQM